jgi:hypothetical protein
MPGHFNSSISDTLDVFCSRHIRSIADVGPESGEDVWLSLNMTAHDFNFAADHGLARAQLKSGFGLQKGEGVCKYLKEQHILSHLQPIEDTRLLKTILGIVSRMEKMLESIFRKQRIHLNLLQRMEFVFLG